MPLPIGGYSNGELASLEYDNTAKRLFKINLLLDGQRTLINNQFPPKITSDSKSAIWDEQHKHGWEEIPIWHGAYARKINIELNYVVWGSAWGWEKISGEVRKLKSHLYVAGVSPGIAAQRDRLPILEISGWQIADGSNEVPTFRMMGVNIEYSKEYVGRGNNQWPLHTKIGLECKLITRGGKSATEPAFREELINGKKIRNLPKIGWV